LKLKHSERGWVTLIELLVVTVIILVVIYLMYGTRTPPGAGVGSTEMTPGGGQATTAAGAALEQARSIECQQNLRSLRELIAAYRIENDQPPASLQELRAGVYSCPVSGNPYVYDPATGTVHCTTPGHERF
jgi:type II secretory pathway pseudopilin PulG